MPFGAEEKILGDPEALKKDLVQRSRKVFEQTRIETGNRLFHVPSPGTYRSFFAWDSGWNVIALAHLDPELAFRELAITVMFGITAFPVPTSTLASCA